MLAEGFSGGVVEDSGMGCWVEGVGRGVGEEEGGLERKRGKGEN